MSTTKKNHHFIPVTYLEKYVDEDDRIYAYLCDRPGEPLHLPPTGIAFERYYYSQPVPGGGRDHNKLEDYFNTIETPWTPLHLRLRSGQADKTDLETLAAFLMLMRVRVPALREAIESMLAQHVAMTARDLDRRGLLPPKPAGAEDILNHMRVSVDPHQSLHAMPNAARGFAHVLSSLRFDVLHNKTNVSFITSDNPVVYFNPSTSERHLVPYLVNPPTGPIELLFSIDPQTMLWGRTGASQLRHRPLRDAEKVRRFNRLIARFAYKLMFATDRSHEALIAKYADTSPIMVFEPLADASGSGLSTRFAFGPRPSLPRWTG